MNKQRLMELAGITEARYAGATIPDDIYVVKVMWVSEDYDIPTTIVGPFKSAEIARHFVNQLDQVDPEGRYIYSADVDTLGVEADPNEFIEELEGMVRY